MAWAENAAYGWLHLRPKDFYELTPLEFMTMVDAYLEEQLSRRWERAYWVANLMSMHTKRPVKPEKLMKPFLPPKTKEEVQQERDQFFAEFEARRKEESHGDHS